MKVFSIQKIKKTVCVLVACISLVGARGQGNVSYIPFKTPTDITNNTINVNLTVGATEGQPTVSNGAAVYKIPIVSAPRPSGTIPIHDLSLVYNSLGGNGLVGKGWSISGSGSVISRSHKVLSLDGVTDPNCTINEVFNIDGVRIFRDLSYAAIGSATERWYTENESFAEIFSYRDNNSKIYKWKITNKDGTIMHYGETSFNLVSAINNTNNNTDCNKSTSEYIAFYLDRIVFPNGNERGFTYTNDPNRTKVISSIYDAYGYHEFFYKIRSDVNKSYPNGKENISDYLLDKIKISLYDYSTPLRTYQMRYSTDDINSFLSEIQEEAFDGTKLNPTIFVYSTSGNYVTNSTNVTLSHQKQNPYSYEYVTGDFNNDGLSDIVAIEKLHNSSKQIDETIRFEVFINGSITNASGTNFTSTYSKNFGISGVENSYKSGVRQNTIKNLLKSDFNGDGLEDIMFHNITLNSSSGILRLSETYLYYSNGNGTFNEVMLPSPNNTQVPAPSTTHFRKNHYYSIYGDFDGDGGSDYIVLTDPLNTGSGGAAYITCPKKGITNQVMTYPQCLGIHNPFQGARQKLNYLQSIDFDGDGKEEIVKISHISSNLQPYNHTMIEVYKITSLTLVEKIYSRMILDDIDELRIADFNGDSKSDLFMKYSNNSFNIFYSTGNTFDEKVIALSPPNKDFYISDFNNDGRSDILYDNNSIYYSNGYSFTSKTTSLSMQNGENAIGDFNGDGNLDIISVTTNANATGPYTPNFNILFFNKDCQHNMLTQLKDGLGAKTTFLYKNMTDNSSDGVYQKEYIGSPYSTDPLKYKNRYYIRKPLWLVSSIHSTITLGAQGSSFKYFGAVNNNEGRGFLGFRQISIFNDGRKLRTDFHANSLQNQQFDEIFHIDKIQAYNSITLQPHYTVQSKYTKVSKGANRFYFTKDEILTDDYVKGYSKNTLTYQPQTGELLTETTENLINGNKTIRTLGYQTSSGNNYGKRPALITSTKIEYIRPGKPSISYLTNMEYNAKAQLTKETRYANTSKSIITEFEYHHIGMPSKTIVTGNGMTPRVSEYFLDPNVGLYIEKERNPLGQEVIYNIDPAHNKPREITSVDGLITDNVYDAWGRLKQITLPTYSSSAQNKLNIYYEWDFSSKGSNTCVYREVAIKTNSATIKKYFDYGNRHIATDKQLFTGDYVTEVTDYNSTGLIAASTTQDYNGQLISKSEFEYDEFDRKIKLLKSPSCNNIGPIEYETTYNRTALGWAVTANMPSSTTIPNGSTETTSMTFDGEVLNSNENNVNDLIYDYDAEGKVVKTQTGNGDILTEIQYDAQGRKNYLKDNSGGVYTYEYNSLGEMTKENNPSGYKIYIYDIYGRKKEEKLNEGYISYTYYPITAGVKSGKIQKISGYIIGNWEEFDYDNLGRLNKITKKIVGAPGSSPFVTQLLYNDQGKIIQKTSPTGNIYTYNYNNFGYQTSISRGTDLIYSLSSIYSSGAIKDYFLGSEKVTNHLDPCNYLSRIETSFFDESYDWDKVNGNLISKTRNPYNEIISYEYDDFDRLNVEDHQTYGVQHGQIYHNNGNIDNKNNAGDYVYHTNRIFAVKNIMNATHSPNEFSGKVQDIYYTSFNKPHTLIQGINQLKLTYDHDFARISSISHVNNVITNKKFYTGYSEFNYDKNNVEKYRMDYIYANGALVAIDIKYPSANSKLWFVFTDYQGSIRVVRDQPFTQGFSLNYDAWGAPIYSNGVHCYNKRPAGVPNWLNVGYTGQEHLYDFGLINLNARLYDPHNARMLSPDNYVTNSTLQGYNRYSYAHNNPTKYVDPDGNTPLPAVAAVVAFAVGGTANVIGNWDNIKDIGSGLAYFGVGGVGGVVTLFAGPATGGVLTGIGNNITTAIVKGKPVDPESAIMDGAISGVVSSVTAGLGDKVVTPGIDKILKDKVINPVVKKVVARGLAGTVTGAIGGGTATALQGGSADDILASASSGAKMGLVTGMAQGAIESIPIRAKTTKNTSDNEVKPKETPTTSDNASTNSNQETKNPNYDQGVEGLKMAGVIQNTERIQSVNGTANYRVPDHMVKEGLEIVEIGEVKNFKVTKKLSLTKQIQDLIDYGEINNVTVRIWLNFGVELTQPLKNYINNKNVFIEWY